MLFDKKPSIIGMDKYRKYALVLPLVQRQGQWYLLFEVRSANLRRQPGEICFPGGKVEAGENYENAAKRECCEELKLQPENIQILQPLDVFISPYDLMVFPYLAELKDYKETFSTDEVAEVFEIPLSWFENHPAKVYKNRVYTELSEDFPYDKIPGGRNYPWGQGSYETVFYFWKEYTIWGLTAAILRGSLEQIKAYLSQEGKSYEDEK